MHDPITAIVPAFNEADTIAAVVNYLQGTSQIAEVIVVDNNSTDTTADVARAAGAQVVSETQQGTGHAFKAGCAAARHPGVMKVDADLERFGPDLVSRLAAARAPGVGLIKGAWQDPGDDMPMTRLLVKPAVATLCPPLAALTAPNSGIYLLDRTRIAHAALCGNYAVDLDAMLRIGWAGHTVAEVDIGEIENDKRNPDHYSGMAQQIMDFFLAAHLEAPGDPLLIYAGCAEDVLLGAMGTAARRAQAGAQVQIFLAESSAGADVLRGAMAPFPTALIHIGLDVTTGLTTSGRARLIASAPGAGIAPLGAARKAQQALGPARTFADILVMDPDARPDHSIAARRGQQIASVARAHAGFSPQPAHDVFTTYQAAGF